MRADVVVLPNATALADAVAERFVAAAAEAIGDRRRFLVALGGGATPRAMFERIASAPRHQPGRRPEPFHQQPNPRSGITL